MTPATEKAISSTRPVTFCAAHQEWQRHQPLQHEEQQGRNQAVRQRDARRRRRRRVEQIGQVVARLLPQGEAQEGRQHHQTDALPHVAREDRIGVDADEQHVEIHVAGPHPPLHHLGERIAGEYPERRGDHREDRDAGDHYDGQPQNLEGRPEGEQGQAEHRQGIDEADDPPEDRLLPQHRLERIGNAVENPERVPLGVQRLERREDQRVRRDEECDGGEPRGAAQARA